MKTETVTTTVYEKMDSLYTVKYICYFDSTGRTTKEVYYDAHGKIKETGVFYYELSANALTNLSKKVKRIYMINADTVKSINFKELKRLKIDSIRFLNDKMERYYKVEKNNIQLIEEIQSDSYGNNLKYTEFNSVGKPFVVVSYEFDYDKGIFKSFTYIKGEKYLVSLGTLNSNHIIDKENYFWVLYSSISVDNEKNVNPEQTFIYKFGQNNQIEERDHIFMVGNVANSVKSQTAISKYTYEYYK